LAVWPFLAAVLGDHETSNSPGAALGAGRALISRQTSAKMVVAAKRKGLRNICVAVVLRGITLLLLLADVLGSPASVWMRQRAEIFGRSAKSFQSPAGEVGSQRKST
jgi:hypothetical protein